MFTAALTCIVATGAWVTNGLVIDDRAFFEPIDHSLIDFETDGAGLPITLGFNQTLTLSPEEFAGVGVRFETTALLEYFRSGSPSIRDAQRIGGSLENYLPFGTLDAGTPFQILFDTPVRAAGFFALTVTTLPAPEFEAFNGFGESLGTFGLVGNLVDGVIADHVVYGYIGIATDEPIARIALSNGAIGWGIDDLRFSAIPAPGAEVVVGVGIALLTRRRQRAH